MFCSNDNKVNESEEYSQCSEEYSFSFGSSHKSHATTKDTEMSDIDGKEDIDERNEINGKDSSDDSDDVNDLEELKVLEDIEDMQALQYLDDLQDLDHLEALDDYEEALVDNEELRSDQIRVNRLSAMLMARHHQHQKHNHRYCSEIVDQLRQSTNALIREMKESRKEFREVTENSTEQIVNALKELHSLFEKILVEELPKLMNQ